MNPALLAILIAALQQIKPEDIAAGLAALATFLDPLIAKRGFVLRTAWKFLRGLVTSPSLVQDVKDLLLDLKVHPEVIAATR